MKTNRIFIVLFLIVATGILASALSAENVTLTTYYPAPFGAYDRIRLVPRDSLPNNPNCDEAKDTGVLYYDNGLGTKREGIYACQKVSATTFDWVFVGRPITAGPAVTQDKIVCLKADGSLGTCTNNPSADGTCGCL